MFPSRKDNANGHINNHWWKLSGEQLAASVFNVCYQIRNNQLSFWTSNLIFAQLYENIEFIMSGYFSPLTSQYFGFTPGASVMNSKLTYNIVKASIDTSTAKIAKANPRVRFITSGGDQKLQTKAKDLTKVLDGLFYETKIYKTATKVFKDSCIFGTGCMKISTNENTKKIEVERVLVPLEIVVDAVEARNGDPKQIHQVKIVQREVLLALYADNQEISNFIMNAESLPNPLGASDELIVVIESWHKPSIKGAKDGKHAISINNCCLLEEPYTKDYFPFLFYKWTDRVQSFFGYGLTEELANIQLAINKLHRMINVAMEINCVPRWFVEAGSLITKHAFYDAGIMEYKPGAQPPIGMTMPAMSNDVFAYLETLYEKAFQTSGISLMSATAQKPGGLDSAVALREYQDVNTERFAIQAQNYQQLFIDAGHIMIDQMKDVYKKNKSVSIKAKSANRKFLENMNWSEVDMSEDDFFMEAFPVSNLPISPEGRLAYITNLAQAGYIDKTTAQELLEMPDIENYYSLTNASFDVVMKDLYAMTEDGEARLPEPFLDLGQAKILALAFYNQSRVANVPDDRLQLIVDYLNNLEELIGQAQQKAQAQQAIQGQGQPSGTDILQQTQALPKTPPRSDLLPQNSVGPRGGQRKT